MSPAPFFSPKRPMGPLEDPPEESVEEAPRSERTEIPLRRGKIQNITIDAWGGSPTFYLGDSTQATATGTGAKAEANREKVETNIEVKTEFRFPRTGQEWWFFLLGMAADIVVGVLLWAILG